MWYSVEDSRIFGFITKFYLNIPQILQILYKLVRIDDDDQVASTHFPYIYES